MSTLEDLLFVEDGSPKGFCSETCIEKYYMPLVDHFEQVEKALRNKFNLKKDEARDAVTDGSYVESVIKRPQEIWRLENDLKEEIFSFISHFEDEKYGKFSIIILCLVFDHQASFILAAISTSHKQLVNEYQIGELIESPEEYYERSRAADSVSSELDGMQIDQESMMAIESKKSRYLARMLEERSASDIQYENFHLYDDYFNMTVEEPDEIYEEEDEEGDTIYIYIKAFEREGVTFFYFALCMRFETNWGSDTETVIPIISFPSLDADIYRKYQRGEKLSGIIKN